jgi:flagellar biosynthetic protein FliR
MKYFYYNFELFLLVFTRMFGMFAVSPFFSSPLISMSLRSIFTFLIAILIFPLVSRYAPAIPDNIWMFLLVTASEFLVGLIIGFIASIFFTVFQMAGEYFSLLMGLSISEVIDPITQVEIPIVGQLQTLIAMLIFFSIYGDHQLISAVVKSYGVLPFLDLTNLQLVKALTDHLLVTASQMFVLSLKLALPLMGTLIVLVISLAVLSKAAPQMNIFMVGFPVQLGVGFVSLIVLAPLLGRGMVRVFEIMNQEILTVIHALR